MDITDIVDWLDLFVIIIAFATAFLAWKVYQISKTRTMTFILIAGIMAAANRFLILFDAPVIYNKVISLIFWLLWAVGLWYMWRLLKAYVKKPKEEPVVIGEVKLTAEIKPGEVIKIIGVKSDTVIK